MTNDSNDAGKAKPAFDPKAVQAFERWHQFHQDLLKLGDFSAWLDEPDNRVDLVSFFAFDKTNMETYALALRHQLDFVDALRSNLSVTSELLAPFRAGGAGG